MQTKTLKQGPNPSGLCLCGCGQAAPLAKRSISRYGHVKGEPIRLVHGHRYRSPIELPPYFQESEDTHCWEWQRYAGHPAGYAYILRRRNGRRLKFYVHRLAYEELVGPIPGGLDLDHLCRNTCCCNPGHLEPVTRAENTRRGRNSKLSHELAAFIRASPLSNKELARMLRVDDSQISRVRTGKTWTPSGLPM